MNYQKIYRKEAVTIAKVTSKSSFNSSKKIRPALTEEGREKQLEALAVDLAEKQLLEGTASSQVIVHFLKQATSRNKLELEKIKHENELLKAKTESIQSQQRSEALYADALEAMKRYSGNGG